MLRNEDSLRLTLGTSMVDCRVLGSFLDLRAEREYEGLEGDDVMCERETGRGEICKTEPMPGIRKLHWKMENLRLITRKLLAKMARVAGSRMMGVMVRVWVINWAARASCVRVGEDCYCGC